MAERFPFGPSHTARAGAAYAHLRLSDRQVGAHKDQASGAALAVGGADPGLGAPENDAEAVGWFRKAAEQGDASAQINTIVQIFRGVRE